MNNVELAIGHLQQAIALLQDLDQPVDPLGPDVGSRVERIGRIAHLHLSFVEQHGTMTVDDSRVIRRNEYGEGSKMRSTANLFGRSNERAILYRVAPYGSRVRWDHEVRLTEEGVLLAQRYRQIHGIAA